MAKFMTADQAAELVQDGSHLAALGAGGGILEPDSVYQAIEEHFLKTGSPNNLTVTAAAGFGDKKDGGINHFAHEGMTKRIIGGHWAWSPRMQRLALENKIEAYNLPQGALVSQYRELASKRAGLITKIGLKTFVDPRVSGGKLNNVTKEELVELIHLDGSEWLHYKPCPIDVAVIRGSIADEEGNISVRFEAANGELLSMAQAAHNNGGIVICQVKYTVKSGSLDPREIVVPGFLIDAVVVEPKQWQSRSGEFNPVLTGSIRQLYTQQIPMPLNSRKIIARRAAMELRAGDVVNLGVGIPDGVAAVAAEEKISAAITMTIEQGLVGGVPSQGDIFGSASSPQAILDAPYQFDFYSGNGLDLTCLGMAQADRYGNVNVSKFGSAIAGCGGFIDISQTAKTCIFCGTFTAGGLETKVDHGELRILKEGKNIKFLNDVEHITFSGQYSLELGQRVLYITERAVFELTLDGLLLTEIAPGIHLEQDVLGKMMFRPLISSSLKTMHPGIFSEAVLGLKL